MNNNKTEQPLWNKPLLENSHLKCPPKVFNSMTNSKVDLIPQNAGKVLKWYVCGPTVYDSTHMGHVRNYISWDIIRRILEDYFGYDVMYVMNVTDIDDKIILRARRNHLLEKYLSANKIVDNNFVELMTQALKLKLDNLTGKEEELRKNLFENKTNPELDLYVKQKQELNEILTNFLNNTQIVGTKMEHILSFESSESSIAVMRESLSEYLDSIDGKSICGEEMKAISRNHAAKFEKEFLEDMKMLGIKYPTVLSRVSEYIPEIIEYIQKIISNGYAYENNGSVYFDTKSFGENPNHHYGKLEPWCVGDSKLMAEAEGALSLDLGDKKNANDFALWKKSKDGEPIWDSPWGQGRPGWHIECSAMASLLIGDVLDIHSGGEDLKFPHHDNELAQAEGYFNNDQWVNYFLHVGHLHISGLKMSKSLKNFITIRQALQDYTPRQVRLMFLSRPWEKGVNYSSEVMDSIKKREKSIFEFFIAVNNLKRVNQEISQMAQKWTEEDYQIHNLFVAKQNEIHECLLNNFDTSGAMDCLFDIIHRCNVYIKSYDGARSLLISEVSDYINKILNIFGVATTTTLDNNNIDNNNIESKEDILSPYLEKFAEFRTNVRNLSLKSKQMDLLEICDDVRDNKLPPLGVRLEDGEKFPWKLGNPEELMKMIAEKKKKENADKLRKLTGRIRVLKADLERLTKVSASPDTIFDGVYPKPEDPNELLPTHELNGNLIPKSKRGKLKKQLDTYIKNHAKYLKAFNENNNFVAETQELIRDYEIQQIELQKLAKN